MIPIASQTDIWDIWAMDERNLWIILGVMFFFALVLWSSMFEAMKDSRYHAAKAERKLEEKKRRAREKEWQKYRSHFDKNGQLKPGHERPESPWRKREREDPRF